jgi:hypothetical protein
MEICVNHFVFNLRLICLAQHEANLSQIFIYIRCCLYGLAKGDVGTHVATATNAL